MKFFSGRNFFTKDYAGWHLRTKAGHYIWGLEFAIGFINYVDSSKIDTYWHSVTHIYIYINI